MEVQQDFKELLELFNVHKVKYLIVGGYALAYHGAPRCTGVIDIFVKPDKENASCILKALDEFGFGSVGLTEEDFKLPSKVVQLGQPPIRIDIVTSISGVSWDEAFNECDKGKYGDVPVNYIGRKHYIINERAPGRKKDIADLKALGEE